MTQTRAAKRIEARYIPDGAKEIKDSESSAVVYVYQYEANTKFLAIGYNATRKNHDFHYYYATKEERDNKIQAFFDAARITEAEKERRTQARKTTSNHQVEEGALFYESWGYDQTNINFYQVVKALPKSVYIREVASTVVDDQVGQEFVVPVPDNFIGNRIIKRVNDIGKDYCLRMTSFSTAFVWSGSPLARTSPYHLR
jgi:hypothetical protein